MKVFIISDHGRLSLVIQQLINTKNIAKALSHRQEKVALRCGCLCLSRPVRISYFEMKSIKHLFHCEQIVFSCRKQTLSRTDTDKQNPEQEG